MNKYLEKIALWNFKDEKNSNLKPAASIAAAATVAEASMLGGIPAVSHSNYLERKWSYPENISEKDQIGSGLTEKEFLKDHPDIAENIKIIKTENGPFLAGVNKGRAFVSGSHNHGITMHELGHIKDLSPGMIGVPEKTMARTSTSRKVLRNGNKVGGLALAFRGARNDNPAEAGLGMYLSHGSTLYGEGIANKHAYSAFKKYEGSAIANKFLKRIALHNTLSYHGLAVGEALAAAGFTKLKKVSVDKRREEAMIHA